MGDINLKISMDTSLSDIADWIFGAEFECDINNMICITTHYNHHHIDPDDDDVLLPWDTKWGDIPHKSLTILAFDSWAFQKVMTYLNIHTVAPSDDDEEVKTVKLFQTPSAFDLWMNIKVLHKEIASLKKEMKVMKEERVKVNETEEGRKRKAWFCCHCWKKEKGSVKLKVFFRDVVLFHPDSPFFKMMFSVADEWGWAPSLQKLVFIVFNRSGTLNLSAGSVMVQREVAFQLMSFSYLLYMT